MGKLIIRQMKIGDEIDLKKNVFPLTDIKIIKENVVNNVADMAKNQDWIYLVAELNDEVIGTTYLKLANESYSSRHTAELFSVVVSENHRQKGICRSLIDQAVKIAKDKKVEMIALTVREGTVADTVYQKLGFISYGVLQNGIKDNDGYYNQKYYFLKIK